MTLVVGMSLIHRNERGSINMKSMDTAILFDGLFAACETAKEVEWVYDQLAAMLERAREEANERLGVGKDDDDEDDANT